MSRVVIAMSGGVDSSVAAALLVEQGHEVVGIHMKLHDANPEVVGRCCGTDDALDARRVANDLAILAREPLSALSADVLVIGDAQYVSAAEGVCRLVARCPRRRRPADGRVVGRRGANAETCCGAESYQRYQRCTSQESGEIQTRSQSISKNFPSEYCVHL